MRSPLPLTSASPAACWRYPLHSQTLRPCLAEYALLKARIGGKTGEEFYHWGTGVGRTVLAVNCASAFLGRWNKALNLAVPEKMFP